MTLDVQCPKCGERMVEHDDRTVHHERIVVMACPRCLHREVVVTSAGHESKQS